MHSSRAMKSSFRITAHAARPKVSGKTAFFPRNDRPYGLKCAAFQTEIALEQEAERPPTSRSASFRHAAARKGPTRSTPGGQGAANVSCRTTSRAEPDNGPSAIVSAGRDVKDAPNKKSLLLTRKKNGTPQPFKLPVTSRRSKNNSPSSLFSLYSQEDCPVKTSRNESARTTWTDTTSSAMPSLAGRNQPLHTLQGRYPALTASCGEEKTLLAPLLLKCRQPELW